MIDRRLAPYGAFVLRLSLGAVAFFHAQDAAYALTADGRGAFFGSAAALDLLRSFVTLAEIVFAIGLLSGYQARGAALGLAAVSLASVVGMGGAMAAPMAVYLGVTAIACALVGDGALAIRTQVAGGRDHGRRQGITEWFGALKFGLR